MNLSERQVAAVRELPTIIGRCEFDKRHSRRLHGILDSVVT